MTVLANLERRPVLLHHILILVSDSNNQPHGRPTDVVDLLGVSDRGGGPPVDLWWTPSHPVDSDGIFRKTMGGVKRKTYPSQHAQARSKRTCVRP